MTALLFWSILWSAPASAGNTPKLFPAHEQGQYGFINKRGRFVIAPRFDEARMFSEGFAAVRRGDLWGYIDEKGRWLVEPRFTDAVRFSEGYAAVKQQGLAGFVDRSGALVVEPTRAGVGNLKSGRALVVEDEAYGFIDERGELVIPATLPWAEPFSDGLAPASLSGELAGFIDPSGSLVIPERYQKVGRPSEGRIAVSTNGSTFHYIDYRGEVVLPGPYAAAADFVEGRAWVKEGKRDVLIDLAGREVPTPPTEERGPFSEGLAAVRVSSGLAFITRSGELVLEGGFEDVLGFQGPVGLVLKDYEWRYITRKSKVVWIDALPPVPDQARLAAEALVGKPILKATHWLGSTETFTATALVGVLPELSAAIDLARIHEGWEVVTPLHGEHGVHYAVYSVGDKQIFREFTLGSEHMEGWLVVEPDATSEDAFRAMFGRETATRKVDRFIASYVEAQSSEQALKLIPEVRSWGAMRQGPLPIALDVHLVRQTLADTP